MKFVAEISFSESGKRELSGAFVRGTAAEEWFAVISTWGADPDAWDYFIIPRSLGDLTPVGILVNFKNAKKPDVSILANPCYVVGGKLFLTFQSEVFPELSSEESNKILLFPVLFFHPAYGLTGFDSADRKSLGDFFNFLPAQQKIWNLAKEGNTQFHPLMYIGVETPPAEEVFKEIEEEVGSKDLKDIPGIEDSSDGSFAGNLGKNILTGILKAGAGIMGMIPFKPGEKDGSLSKLKKWIDKNLENLQKKREQEIERLLKLFRENPEEALKYALPINPKYQGRGKGEKSDSLSKRDSNFDLSRLGGGERGDVWDISKYQNDLRVKYYETAKACAAKGDHKKAAYIYAHLLGDYFSAASALKEGKYYKEAALIYRDHCNNLNLAADCFEDGGYYSQAIEIHIGQKNFEKAGDVCRRTEIEEKAVEFYNAAIEEADRKGLVLESARIANLKIGDTERAKTILLKGWKNSAFEEKSLKEYLMLIKHEDESVLAKEIQKLGNDTTIIPKQDKYLNVIREIALSTSNPDVIDVCRIQAFQHATQLHEMGFDQHLLELESFAGSDRLLGSDILNSLSTSKRLIPKRPYTRMITVDMKYSDKEEARIHWFWAASTRGIFITIGRKENYLAVGITEWNKGTSVHLIPFMTFGATEIEVLHSIYNWEFFLLSNEVILKEKYEIQHPQFPGNFVIQGIYHEELESEVAFCLLPANKIYGLWISPDGNLSLNFYKSHEQLGDRDTVQLKFADGKPVPAQNWSERQTGLFRRGFMFVPYQNGIMRINTSNGVTNFIETGFPVSFIDAPGHNGLLKIYGIIDGGFCTVLFEPGDKWKISTWRQCGFTPQKLAFLPDHFLAVSAGLKIQVYDVSRNNIEPVFEQEVSSGIIYLGDGDRSNVLAVLTKDNNLTLTRIKD